MLSEAVITQAVRTLCQRHCAGPVTVTLAECVLPDDWGRNLVWRYSVTTEADFPATVIAKISKLGGGHIYNEWASLQFLNQFAELSALIPKFYGGDAQHDLLVLEDMGAIRSQHDLGTILEGDDPNLARRALLGHAREMARLHVATAAHEVTFTALRQQFPAAGAVTGKDQFAGNFAWLLTSLPDFGVAVSPAMRAEAQAIIDSLQRADGPRAYTRGDACPSNVAFVAEQVRFYDFEMGGYRSMLLSAAYFLIWHVSCLNGNLLPPTLREEAEQVYFDGLSALGYSKADLQVDYAAAATTMLVWILSLYLEKPDRPRHLATHYQRLFAALSLYIEQPGFAEPFPQIATALKQLQAVLAEGWPSAERTIALFPAFRQL